MFSPEDLDGLREEISLCAGGDARLLEQTRDDVRAIRDLARPIAPVGSSAVSLVAGDGGNNGIDFDPFYLQLVRVVDSTGKCHCLDVVSPTTDTTRLSLRQYGVGNGSERTALGELMDDLGLDTRNLHQLSYNIPPAHSVQTHPERVSRQWIETYRDLVEWAVLYRFIKQGEFETDAVVIRDGLLRSNQFSREVVPQVSRAPRA